MRTRKFLGGLVALGFIVVSTAMAIRFGYELGIAEHDRILYATAGGLADVLKSLLPLFIVAAYLARQWVRCALACVVFVIFTCYSLAASFGLAAIQSAGKVGTHAAEVRTVKDQRAELARLQKQRDALGVPRPVPTIEADIRAAKLDKAWGTSKECTDITAQASRTLCQQIERLEGERSTATTANDLERQIATLRGKLSASDDGKADVEADPQAAAISKLLGFDKDTVRGGLHALVAILLELGSGLGLYLVFGHHGRASERREPDHGSAPATVAQMSAPVMAPAITVEGPADAIARFALERIRPAQGERVAASTLFAHYETWCETQGLEPVSAAMFGRLVDWRKERIGGRVWYLDAAIAGAVPSLRVAIDNTAALPQSA